MLPEQIEILIVDDDKYFRGLIRERLLNFGFDVAEACDGEQAIARLRVETYDVILLDLNMPNKDGFDVLSWLKQNKCVHATNIVILTTECDRDSLISALSLGANDFLSKAASRLELITRIKHQCQSRSLEKINRFMSEDKTFLTSHILVVDDDHLSLDLTSRRIQQHGFDSLLAQSGEEALQLMRDTKVDLVLLDINLPGINGFKVLKEIRQYYAQDDLAVVMVSAIEDPDMVIDCINYGANDYIMKPFHPLELIARINSVLSHTQVRYR